MRLKISVTLVPWQLVEILLAHYTINSNNYYGCVNTPTSLNTYGFVVGGSVNTVDTHVHGSVYLGKGGTVNQVQQLNQACAFVVGEGTGEVNFYDIGIGAVYSNYVLSLTRPTMILHSNGDLTKIISSSGNSTQFNVLTFNVCSNKNCIIWNGLLSYPNSMLQGQGNWNGPQILPWPPSGITVFNVHIASGSTFRLSRNIPTIGLDPCRTLFNFYPVKDDGSYDAVGTFTLVRETGGPFGGLTLAPLDGTSVAITTFPAFTSTPTNTHTPTVTVSVTVTETDRSICFPTPTPTIDGGDGTCIAKKCASHGPCAFDRDSPECAYFKLGCLHSYMNKNTHRSKPRPKAMYTPDKSPKGYRIKQCVARKHGHLQPKQAPKCKQKNKEYF
ncbi:hypothetical protein PHYBLDRAFT_172027 [Phycomyces blakesleeanus NRRL 1555(-)]|uniref:Uncharacterized protein n=1 Tax=Phycomyces blakesleeanus (strain ATCC 8743b / DSM 1359 / FGSC 10004 / NBRC 33097 / NRRL 1555) TaxID=763407 RepID=A0A162TPC9_PHYB8|nr:hypothetical protein PHYBLDRAFT_172027 [Phycomyces blakesleeanus NRRL 1555(-)]OAD70012.1 hypothetical protein PHYBLDRAFT_172027 [Phycomyces blakesleeanus NRRL 1555(-)]|eukprot:XP_018288052.1 hypothetical protein PHYBLDRAFT_172027 [Phycomyces blakesleeanus NRRL 1555(-)]